MLFLNYYEILFSKTDSIEEALMLITSSKILFFVASLIIPIYIITNPKIISVITNFIVGNKRNEFSQGKNNDVFSIVKQCGNAIQYILLECRTE